MQDSTFVWRRLSYAEFLTVKYGFVILFLVEEFEENLQVSFVIVILKQVSLLNWTVVKFTYIIYALAFAYHVYVSSSSKTVEKNERSGTF